MGPSLDQKCCGQTWEALRVTGSMGKARHRDQRVSTRSQARERQRLWAAPARDSSVFPPLPEQNETRQERPSR